MIDVQDENKKDCKSTIEYLTENVEMAPETTNFVGTVFLNTCKMKKPRITSILE